MLHQYCYKMYTNTESELTLKRACTGFGLDFKMASFSHIPTSLFYFLNCHIIDSEGVSKGGNSEGGASVSVVIPH